MGSFIFLTKIENTQANGHVLQDEIQTVALSNATGGTFRLAYLGQTTQPIAYNASAAAVDAALEALSTVGTGAVTVSLAASTYTITFGGGALNDTNVNSLQGDVSTATYGTVDRMLTTTYNAAHEITQQSDPSATIAYTRDNLGRATSIVNTIAGLTPTVTFDQTFNAGSDRTQVKAKIGSTNDFKTDYTYDTLGRVTDIIQQANSGNAVASKRVTLAYNKLGQFTAFNRYESTGTTNQVASTDFAYDTLNRLTDIDHKQGSTILASYDYTFDFASRLTSVNSFRDGLTTYTHDKTDQLTGADHTGQTDETYTFDANGNRSSYTLGTNNLITSDGTNTYQYDDEGNRTRVTVISTGAYTTYTWDYRNRLTAVKDYNSSNVLLKETTYSYDMQNRLIKSTYDADGAGAGVATTRYWAFDEGINPLLEFKGPAASDVSHRYLWGPAVDQLFADEQPTSTASAGNVLWALADNLGTIRDIADLSGSTTSVINHRRFGAFGNLVSESNAAVDMVFAFTGKLYDENTKLQNNLNRWYDAATGQWLSEDPIGFAGGDENVRRYVGNTVLSSWDPTGKIIETVWDVGCVIWDGGVITVGIITADPVLIRQGTTDLVIDVGSMLIPVVPAGGGRLLRAIPTPTPHLNKVASNIPTAPVIGTANPKSLLSRQGPHEMTPSRVQDMSEDMMTGQFPWARSGPIDVAQGPSGVTIILDGHHRTQAAIEAGLEVVPVRIHPVTPERWGELMQDVLQSGGIR